jgi:prepilin-type N-terminal cleavage/methylation domain-containing protein
MKKISKGFTLIELLVVIGILAILLAITLIAINPARQFGQANNTRRRSDILQILNSVHQYVAETQGQLPPELTALKEATPNNVATEFSFANFPLLCNLLTPNYIPALPMDPSIVGGANITSCATGWVTGITTGYDIAVDGQGRVTVSAPTTDNSAVITVTR